MEAQSCLEGYTGPKCSMCVRVDRTKDCDDEATTLLEKGFYRFDQRCEPCPCSWFGFTEMVVLAMFMFVGVLAAVDRIHATSAAADYLSAKTAPLVIMLTFGQTLGLLLDIDSIPWPPSLRLLMQRLNAILNLNIENGPCDTHTLCLPIVAAITPDKGSSQKKTKQ